MKRNLFIIISILIAFASCATTGRKGVVESPVAHTLEQQVDSAMLFSFDKFKERVDTAYRKEDIPLIYYTEGVKRLGLFEDARSAVKLFRESLKLDSTYAPAYYELATVLAGTPKQALVCIRKANELDSTELRYKELLGRLLVMNGLYDEAQTHYDELIKLAPRNPENYSMLAALYEQAGQPFSAIGILERAETVFGKVEQLMEYKRELLIKVRLYDRAIDEGKELVTANPYNYRNHLALAQLYAETKNDSLAKVSYQNALALSPNGLDVLLSMQEFYRVTSQNSDYLGTVRKLIQNEELSVDTKLALFKEATSSRTMYVDHRFQIRELAMLMFANYPDNYEVINQYVNNLLAFGEVEEALTTYKRYVGTDVGGIDLYYEIMGLEAYLERTDSVSRYLNLALEKYPNNADLYIRQGGTYQYKSQYKDARKVYAKALKYSETDSLKSIVYGFMGDVAYMEDDIKRSYKYYQKALEFDDDNTIVLNNYAYHLSQRGDNLEEALRMSKKVVDELEPGNPTYIDTYGWVLYKLGRYEEARKALQQAVALDVRNNKELLLHYGDILHKLGENYMASVYWNRALEAGYDESEINKRLASIAGK